MRITLPFFQNANRSRCTVSTRSKTKNDSPITRIWNTFSCDSGLPLYSLFNSDCGDREYMRTAPTMSRSQYDGLRSRKYHFKILLRHGRYLGVSGGLALMALARNTRDSDLMPYWGTEFLFACQNPLLYLVPNYEIHLPFVCLVRFMKVDLCFSKRAECCGRQLGGSGVMTLACNMITQDSIPY